MSMSKNGNSTLTPYSYSYSLLALPIGNLESGPQTSNICGHLHESA